MEGLDGLDEAQNIHTDSEFTQRFRPRYNVYSQLYIAPEFLLSIERVFCALLVYI